jgi:GrpB-like predicted nucleotidyltransferase (UPF0157 family)
MPIDANDPKAKFAAHLIGAAPSSILLTMSHESEFRLVDTEPARVAAQQLFEAVSRSLAGILPPTADIRHVGATAVPGCLTKGDLDIVVRVTAEDFKAADTALALRYARNDGSVRSTDFSALEDASDHPHLGIQLTAIDSPFDSFHLFAEALRQSPQLVDKYNALKRAHDGGDMSVYRAAKDAFVEKVLADISSLT